MNANVERFNEVVEYDEAEVRRRMVHVYGLILEAARQKRLLDAQAAAAQTPPEEGGAMP